MSEAEDDAPERDAGEHMRQDEAEAARALLEERSAELEWKATVYARARGQV